MAPSAKVSDCAAKPPLPIVNLSHHGRVLDRDDPPGFRGRVNLAAAGSEAFYRLACIVFIGDKEKPTRHGRPKFDYPILQNRFKWLRYCRFGTHSRESPLSE